MTTTDAPAPTDAQVPTLPIVGPIVEVLDRAAHELLGGTTTSATTAETTTGLVLRPHRHPGVFSR